MASEERQIDAYCTMLETRLAEAEALLRECKLDQWENVEEMAAWRDDRDAFLAADSASVCPRCNGHGVVPDLRGDQPCPDCTTGSASCGHTAYTLVCRDCGQQHPAVSEIHNMPASTVTATPEVKP